MECPEREKKTLSLLAEKVGRKVAFDIISHCHDNKPMEDMVDALKKNFDESDAACVSFLGNFINENEGEYLLDLLLECTDGLSRALTGDLLEHCLDRLKEIEKDMILEVDEAGKSKSYAV